MSVRVAINGFGRIGRATLRASFEQTNGEVDWVAVNDLVDAETLAYLLRHDTVFGRFDGSVRATDGAVAVDGHELRSFSESDPRALPWEELGVDVVIEATGRFRTRAEAAGHLE